MGPTLRFLGTGRSEDIRGVLNEGGFLISTDSSLILIDPGVGAAQALAQQKINSVTRIIISDKAFAHDADLIKTTGDLSGIEIAELPCGSRITLPDCTVSYITKAIPAKESKNYTADVIILAHHKDSEKLLKKLNPKLAILTGFDKEMHEKNPLYLAREIHKASGIQVIAAHDGLIVNLTSYSALSDQKSLGKF